MRVYILLLATIVFFVGCGSSAPSLYIASKNPKQVFLDKHTGLMWRDDKRPPWYSGTYNGSKPFCNDLVLAGYDDWRIPSIKELVTLIDYSKKNSWLRGYKNSYRTMIKNEFKGLQILPGKSDNFMSSTLNSKGQYLGLSYRYGSISSYNTKKSKLSRIICVRGEEKVLY